MTNSIRKSALLALICIAFRLSCLSAANPGMLADPQDVATSGSVDNSKPGPVWILAEYACKKGAHHKAEREGLISVVMQRGADSQPTRVLGAKDSKTGDVAFIHVLDSDCSGEQPIVAQGGASLALVHKVSGEEYFYAISGQGECMRASQIRFAGQLVPVDMSTKIQDCQNEVRIWSGQAAKWKAQANSADKTKP
jgi:hypothetical protein